MTCPPMQSHSLVRAMHTRNCMVDWTIVLVLVLMALAFGLVVWSFYSKH